MYSQDKLRIRWEMATTTCRFTVLFLIPLDQQFHYHLEPRPLNTPIKQHSPRPHKHTGGCVPPPQSHHQAGYGYAPRPHWTSYRGTKSQLVCPAFVTFSCRQSRWGHRRLHHLRLPHSRGVTHSITGLRDRIATEIYNWMGYSPSAKQHPT